MLKRLAALFDSIVYAGLRPDQKPEEGKKKSGFGLLNRYLDGGKQLDPLYLSNQTVWQKCRRPLLVILPLVLIATVIALSAARMIHKETAPQAEPTAAEVASRSLNFKDLKIDANRDVQVLEAAVKTEGGSPVVKGKLQNNTDRLLAMVDVVLELTDTAGSQLGRHHVLVRDLGPRSIATFESPIKPEGAVGAVVVEIHTQ